jgi:2'-5' RNA ligase
VRAFLAIPVLPPALAGVQSLRSRLVAEIDSVRWAPADSPHITLHFFGSISATEAARALAALRPATAVHSTMALRLHRLGVFPSLRGARVLWCGVDGEVAALASLVDDCATVLRAAGFAVDDRAFHPHCTLGRPRQPWPSTSLERWEAEAAAEPATAVFRADRTVLYESVREAAGVRHVARDTLLLR